MSRWARNRVYIVRSNIPKILYDTPMMSLLQSKCEKIANDANDLASLQSVMRRGKPLTAEKKPYIGYVIHTEHTPLGIVRTRTQTGARDQIRDDTLRTALYHNSVGDCEFKDVAYPFKKAVKQATEAARPLSPTKQKAAVRKAATAAAKRQRERVKTMAWHAWNSGEGKGTFDKKASLKSISRHQAKVTGRKRTGNRKKAGK